MRTIKSKFLLIGIFITAISVILTLGVYQSSPRNATTAVALDHPYLITDTSTNYIVINDAGFAPMNMAIEAGESVTWHNATETTHVLVSGIPPVDDLTAVYLPMIFKNGADSQTEVTGFEGVDNNTLPSLSMQTGTPVVTLLPGEDLTLAFDMVGTYDYYLETAVQFTNQIVVNERGATTIERTSPTNGEGQVSVARETIIEFSHPLDPNSVTDSAIYTQFGGNIQSATLYLSPDHKKVTLFYDQPLPASARVRLTIDGDQLVDDAGNAVDADGDGIEGGVALVDFDTLGITVIPGTSVCGTVYASELSDDGNGGTVDVPLAGTTITVDGMEDTLFTITDATGDFCLDPAPAGRFFVHIDGRTVTVGVPPGAYYPYVGKAWQSTPGMQTNVGIAHLPLVVPGTLQAVSDTTDTDISFPQTVLDDHPEFADVVIQVPADSLYANDGIRGGQVGIAPVPPDRLPGTLPENLRFPLVITVQTDGATNFDTPAPVCFPNLPDPDTGDTLAPGAKSALLSFNHDSGQWGIVGSMTISDDGSLACTDPGVGILAPGWHGTQDSSDGSGSGGDGSGGDGSGGDGDGDSCEEDDGEDTTIHHLVRVLQGDIAEVDLTQDLDSEQSHNLRDFAIVHLAHRGAIVKRIESSQVDYETVLENDGKLYFAPSTDPLGIGPTEIVVEAKSDNFDCDGEQLEDKFVTITIQFLVAEGYSSTGPNIVPPSFDRNRGLDVYRVQQRLRFLGFFGENKHPLVVDGVFGNNTRWSIGLFNHAVNDRNPHNNFRRNSFDAEGQRWINLQNAPRWQKAPAGGTVWTNADTNNHDWGTSWAIEAIEEAGSQNFSLAILQTNDLSKKAGGNTSSHKTHEAGMDIDVRLVSPGGPWFDIAQVVAHLNTNGTFWTQAAPRPALAGDPFTTNYSGNNGWRIDKTIHFLHKELGTGSAYDQRIQAQGGFDAVIPLRGGDTAYDREATTAQIRAFNNESIAQIIYNDPVVRQILKDEGISFTWAYAAAHSHHFHVDVASPYPDNALEQSSITQTRQRQTLSDSGFGDDYRPYYHFDLGSGVSIRGRTNWQGDFSQILPALARYTVTFYRASTNQWITYEGGTNNSGERTEMGTVIFDQVGGIDSDGDGLPDMGELAIGTDPNNTDTDGDGISDSAEIEQGTNPLDGLPVHTGIIASADTPGDAVDVCALNELAIVADSGAGISVFNVNNGQTPIAIAQVDTPGTATRVTCANDVVAVADGSAGLAIVDITDPPAANIIHQLPLGNVKAVAATAGIVYAGAADGSITAVNLQDGATIDSVDIGEPVLDMQLGRDVLYVYAKANLYTISLLGGMAIIDNDSSPGTYAANEIRPLRLFVGDDIAYAVHRKGYNTFDLTDPANPTLIANGNTTQFGWRHIVDNGSGLGLAAVSPNSNADGPHHVSLYDVSDPAQTNQFLTEFETPGLATAVSIYNGLAYVADGEAGLQVVNYLAYDALGVAPTITIATNATAGTIEEGQVLHFGAAVDDDVQVRNVAFYIDNEQATVDGNFPFAHRFITPLLSQQTSLVLTTKATDTGGNLTWAMPITLTIVPDMTPPQAPNVIPADGAALYDTAFPVTAVSANFNEPINPATLTSNSFQLYAAGADGTIGTGDDTQILTGTLSYQEPLNMALLTFANPLPVDQYQVIISSTVTDMAGNALTTPFSWQFQVTDGAFGDWNLSRSIAFNNPQAAHYNPFDDLIYVGRRDTASDGLYRIEADDSATLLAAGDRIAAVAVDPQTGHIFASEGNIGNIYRTEFGSTGRTTWVSGLHDGDDDPIGMAFAPALYSGTVISPGDGLVVDRGANGLDEVWRFSASVAEGETAVHADNGTLVDALDITIGLNDVYLVDDKDAGDGVIYRLHADGSLTAVSTTSPIPAPEGIAIDPLTGDLFIVDINEDKVLRVNPTTGVVSDAVPSFTFTFTSAAGTSYAGVDFSPDGQTLIITDKGTDVIYVFTRVSN